ncbi:hypothetical protein [Rheinheimera sp.]|uniref:hypothetical protein n=1 Tax=Rheinheimera sp. TaxID=1869214 RepID=UPI0027362FF8|nr:hypothetical protein [Rheinheimera sp.]MDP2716814.1 hypothetical protein [Rheinheimera sp.]
MYELYLKKQVLEHGAALLGLAAKSAEVVLLLQHKVDFLITAELTSLDQPMDTSSEILPSADNI